MYKTLHKKQGSVTVQLRFARSSVTFCAPRDIYIAGKDSAPIEDLTLNNIRLELEKTTKYPIKGYDFRPCCGPDFQEGKINGIYVKNAKNVKAENLEVTVHDNMKEWVDKEICFENAVVKEK